VLAIPASFIRAGAGGFFNLTLLIEAHADFIRLKLAALHSGR
jgi:hypothetical protein